MFSANLNRNKRIENFTLWADPTMVSEYVAMVDELWAAQGVSEGFDESWAVRRKAGKEVAGPPVNRHPPRFAPV